MKYFAYDPGNEEFRLFDTEEEARNHAQSLIDGYRAEGDEEWPEWTDGICWGHVTQRADARLFSSEYNPDILYEEYKLTDVE